MTLLETTNEGAAEPVRLTTPLGQAIGNLFARALPLLDGNPPGSLKVFVFGGCAVHLLTHARGSADIDAEIEAARVLRKDEIMAVYTPPEGYEDGDGRDLQVYLDQNYTNALGPLHEDYRERAIPMEGFEGEQPLHIFVAAGVDLAISSSAALRKTINMISNSSSNVAVSMSASLLHWQQRQSIMPWATEAQC